MKNKIFYSIILIVCSYANLLLSGESALSTSTECPPLNYIQIFDDTGSKNHQLDGLCFNSNFEGGSAFPITQKALDELKKAPDGPVTCLYYHESWNMAVGGIIPADIMQKIKNFKTANPSNDREATIYAFNTYSPQDIWNKTDSQKKDSRRESTIKELQKEWLEAQKQASSKINNSHFSITKPLIAMACLFSAAGLYLLWRCYR